MTTVIGLIGGKGVGKTTLAQALKREIEVCEIIKMADPLKNMLRGFGLTEEEIEGSLKEVPSSKLNGHTPRHAMQTLGTEWGRTHMGRDFWISAWVRDVQETCADVVITDDIRFFNEAQAVIGQGGHLVYLGGVSEDNFHQSETEMHAIPAEFPVIDLVGRFQRDLTALPAMVEYILSQTIKKVSATAPYIDDEEIPF